MRAQIEAVWQDHLDLMRSLQQTQLDVLADIVSAIVTCLHQGGCLYICGNGGSAADAQHIAAEFVGRFAYTRKALPAIALTVDTSALTAISNDFGFEEVFARQVEALVTERDLFWGLSTSGNSPNVVKAAALARKQGARVVAFTGRSPSQLEPLSDLCFCAAHPDTARSQEAHQLAYHIICKQVETELCPRQS